MIEVVRCGSGADSRGVDDPVQSPDQLAAVGAVVDAQQQVGPDVRRGPLVQRPGLDVVELQGRRLSVAVTRRHTPSIAQWCSGSLGGSGLGCREVGEGPPGGPAGVVDPVADDRPVPGVDQLGEDRVDDVVVQGAAPAGPVRFAATGGELDLEVGPVLDVGLGDVDDEEVGEDQVGQRVVSVLVEGPVRPCRRGRPRTRGWRSAGPGRRPGSCPRGGTRPPCCTGRGSPGPG